MGFLQIVYIAIAAVVALSCLWSLIKEKSLSRAACLGILLIPLLLRVFMIK